MLHVLDDVNKYKKPTREERELLAKNLRTILVDCLFANGKLRIKVAHSTKSKYKVYIMSVLGWW